MTQNSAFLEHPWTVGNFFGKVPTVLCMLICVGKYVFLTSVGFTWTILAVGTIFCVYFKISGNFSTVQNRRNFRDFKYYTCITVWGRSYLPLFSLNYVIRSPWERFFCDFLKNLKIFPRSRIVGISVISSIICITVWEEVICHFLALIT